MKKRCAICKKTFDATTTWQEFCSPACRAKAFRRRHKKDGK